jgi:hypothetical protein
MGRIDETGHRIRAELLAKPTNNSANLAGFCIFENFLFLTRLNCVSVEFSRVFPDFSEFSKNRRER